jgi:hypothetical protein
MSWPRFAGAGLVIGVGVFVALMAASGWVALGVLGIVGVLAALIFNVSRPVVRGAQIEEGYPGEVMNEFVRELKWFGTFDIPNMWARDKHLIGKTPATEFFNDLVERGIWGEMTWKALLGIGYTGVIIPGILEIRIPFLSEALFIGIMILILHVKVTSAIGSFLNSIGRLSHFEEGLETEKAEEGDDFIVRVAKQQHNMSVSHGS